MSLFQVIVDDDNSKEWKMYDAGPKTIRCPLICFPPASGSADVFFRQILGLTSAGYRVIAVSEELDGCDGWWCGGHDKW